MRTNGREKSSSMRTRYLASTLPLFMLALQACVAAATPVDVPANEAPSAKEARPRTDKITYVLDASEQAAGMFDGVRREMKKSLDNVQTTQSIQIILATDGKVSALDDKLLLATPENKKKAVEFLDAAKPKGESGLAAVLQKALEGGPDFIYFTVMVTADLKGLPELVEKLDPKHKIRIMALVFQKKDEKAPDRKFEEALKKIVMPGRGMFRVMREEDLKD